jgi:ubiquinone biosynthesis protein
MDATPPPPPPPPAISRTALARRSAALCGRTLVGAATLGPAVALGLTRRDLSARTERWLADFVTHLGPAFIKMAQLLATRADLLPPRVCAALGRLHDAVEPNTLSSGLPPRLLEDKRLTVETDADGVAQPVASGSIACVYRATDAAGRPVAVKVRRPGVEHELATDLELIRRITRMAARLPPLRGMPAVEIVDQLTAAIHAQLDFPREARHLSQLRANLNRIGRVHVPEVHAELCDEEVLVMEFLDGLSRHTAARLPAPDREQAVLATLHSVYHMLFIDGLVHCDLHPGNVYFRADGTVALVDAGFTVRLDQEAREKFAAFFMRMSYGHGTACAQIVLSTAIPGPRTDVDGFTRDLADLVHENSGARAADFDLVRFAARLFTLQRRHGLYADPQFVFPLLSLLVLEGTVRAHAPKVDFQKEAEPYILDALFARVFEAHGTPTGS